MSETTIEDFSLDYYFYGVPAVDVYTAAREPAPAGTRVYGDFWTARTNATENNEYLQLTAPHVFVIQPKASEKNSNQFTLSGARPFVAQLLVNQHAGEQLHNAMCSLSAILLNGHSIYDVLGLAEHPLAPITFETLLPVLKKLYCLEITVSNAANGEIELDWVKIILWQHLKINELSHKTLQIV